MAGVEVERYVFMKFHDEWSTPEGRAEVVAKTREVFAKIPQVVEFSAGSPADEVAEAAWDLSIRVRFASYDDYPGYQSDPIHRDYVDNYMKPKVVVAKAWNMNV